MDVSIDSKQLRLNIAPHNHIYPRIKVNKNENRYSQYTRLSSNATTNPSM